MSMNVESHLNALKGKHAELDTALTKEEHRPQPDPVAVAILKKQKLKIKEELAQLAQAGS